MKCESFIPGNVEALGGAGVECPAIAGVVDARGKDWSALPSAIMSRAVCASSGGILRIGEMDK